MRMLLVHQVRFLTDTGELLATVELTPAREGGNHDSAPLIQIDAAEARQHGETPVQLRESERYEYEVFAEGGSDLRLRCDLARRRRSLGSDGKPDAGLIETRSFCGTLLLELVEGDASDLTKPAVTSTLIEVRSLKLAYRTEYRGMLKRLAREMEGLIADARSASKVGFRSNYEDRSGKSGEEGWFQIQLELLRETLDSAEFAAALQRIISFPHEQLSAVDEIVATDRPVRWTPRAVQQLVTRTPRRVVPQSHPLGVYLGLNSIAERVVLPSKSRDLDTPENRFVKFSLVEYQTFLGHALTVFDGAKGWGAAAALARRLATFVDDWLGRGMFREIGDIRFAPLSSPVLQRKAGYRELLRWWLRFRTAAELSWKGGEDVFHAGQRDVATLYEYWLFFELLDWFCKRCRDGERPEIEELIDGLGVGEPNLRLKKQAELGPFCGAFGGGSRQVNARFAYNRRFEVTVGRDQGGSWTRRLHPDYTLTFWPNSMTEEKAEESELLVHVHFDAKYRVGNLDDLFGQKDDEDVDGEIDGNYNRQDLLKMHAYRDAIKRSQGAYVLYPGSANSQKRFTGFHEILPGLGAFGVAPDENGDAKGMDALKTFLDEVLTHLSNRTTALERVSYHVAESYRLKEEPVQYGSLVLAERDELSDTTRALPPSEHHVVLAWYNTPEQLAWTLDKGIANVRLGDRPGTWHIPPEMASARHVLLRTHGGKVAEGLFRLTKPGYKVYSASDLTAKGYPGAAGGEIYAVFEVEPDAAYAGRKWDEPEVTKQIKAFESRRAYRQVKTLHRRSPDPRVLSLQDLLRALR